MKEKVSHPEALLRLATTEPVPELSEEVNIEVPEFCKVYLKLC